MVHSAHRLHNFVCVNVNTFVKWCSPWWRNRAKVRSRQGQGTRRPENKIMLFIQTFPLENLPKVFCWSFLHWFVSSCNSRCRRWWGSWRRLPKGSWRLRGCHCDQDSTFRCFFSPKLSETRLEATTQCLDHYIGDSNWYWICRSISNDEMSTLFRRRDT